LCYLCGRIKKKCLAEANTRKPGESPEINTIPTEELKVLAYYMANLFP